MMTDNHVAGEGNAYYTLFREYDPDLGRWWRPDPIFQPWQSPYSAFDGNPIMFTDVWGLEAEKDPLKGFTPEDPLITPNVVVTADALEGTRKSAVDILGRRAYNLETNPFKKMDYIKHDGKWVSSLEYDNAMSKLINGLDQKGYDPILHGFDFDEEMSDNFWSMFNAKGARKYKLERLPHTGVLNPFFAGHGLEDNSQEMAALLGLAGGLFKKAIGWLAEKGAAKLSIEVVEVLAKDLVKGDATEATKIGFNSGTAGESYLASLVSGSPQEFFKTSLGNRFIDQLSNGIAHESKVGYTVLSTRIKTQILKDVELIQSRQIKASTWHFFRSSITGKIGPSKPLQDFLTKNGINFIIYK